GGTSIGSVKVAPGCSRTRIYRVPIPTDVESRLKKAVRVSDDGEPRLFLSADNLRSHSPLLRSRLDSLAASGCCSVHVHQRLPCASFARSEVLWCSRPVSLSMVLSPELSTSAVAA